MSGPPSTAPRPAPPPPVPGSNAAAAKDPGSSEPGRESATPDDATGAPLVTGAPLATGAGEDPSEPSRSGTVVGEAVPVAVPDSAPDAPGVDPSATGSAEPAGGATAATAATATEPDEPEAAHPGKTPLGWVAGRPLTTADLLTTWQQASGRQVWLVLDKLVATQLAVAEGQRLGLRLDPARVEARVAEDRRALAREAEAQGDGLSVDEYVERELGMSLANAFERMRLAVVHQMLAERAVRAWTLSNENLAVRVIVVPGPPDDPLVSEPDAAAAGDAPDLVREVQAALAEGRDFAELAREFSVDDSAAEGGLVPFLVRQEHSALARMAFQTEVGKVSGPIRITGHAFFVRVEEAREPVEGRWDEVASAVEASLAEHRVRDSEFVHWRVAMEKRYAIDLDPLLEILGAGE